MDNSDDLGLLLRSRYPLLVTDTRNEERLLGMVRATTSSMGLPVWT